METPQFQRDLFAACISTCNHKVAGEHCKIPATDRDCKVLFNVMSLLMSCLF